MISSLKYTAPSPLAGSAAFSCRKRVPVPRLPPSIQNLQQSTALPSFSSHKPLYIIPCTQNLTLSTKPRRKVAGCHAYEADKSQPQAAETSEAAQKLKIGLYFATWWALNVVFNIYNKKVAVAHTIGHVAATVSMSKVAVSFTHHIKSGEPAFSVLVSRFLLGKSFPIPVYLSLVPIIGGCALAAVTELNYNMIGFVGAMISNLAFVFRNIFSKKGMKGMSVSGLNYCACLSILSLLILIPFAILVEGPKMWAVGWQTALSQIRPNFVWEHNEENFSNFLFHTPIHPTNAVAAAIAILGTFLYSQTKFSFLSCNLRLRRIYFDSIRTKNELWNSHPMTAFEDSSTLCKCLNYKKLSFQVWKDLVKNPRIPPRIAMQALISQKAKIPSSLFAINGSRIMQE
ncbi:hypothetical protein Ahy_B01g055894 [Arachis hypogaea]|uniref:Sugar phosphate transporter domain-containing protein n=1 Tax=Arachis hypogaea TaxID=3818 RepID=A0A445AXE9_ARAHY|nr:hypothetical protein Ahy_B01g055894 [Arachis hypogaea]